MIFFSGGEQPNETQKISDFLFTRRHCFQLCFVFFPSVGIYFMQAIKKRENSGSFVPLNSIPGAHTTLPTPRYELGRSFGRVIKFYKNFDFHAKKGRGGGEATQAENDGGKKGWKVEDFSWGIPSDHCNKLSIYYLVHTLRHSYFFPLFLPSFHFRGPPCIRKSWQRFTQVSTYHSPTTEWINNSLCGTNWIFCCIFLISGFFLCAVTVRQTGEGGLRAEGKTRKWGKHTHKMKRKVLKVFHCRKLQMILT